ncbi:LOW QUALITY PROTEIN: melanin-concentrating hormone receptor 1-like [Rhincodon typus]|uniref:LOW QUALITY PROTEIN: melanin-concentrating hormone receptor 1-like n=1 Tax=Rhincodon typus TaxID=259920 RepID=UPI00202F4118|nr:LOW QUALITY PROTEIN: melanin-concentrating hormone receptor 1-like [Rhincodon typus]
MTLQACVCSVNGHLESSRFTPEGIMNEPVGVWLNAFSESLTMKRSTLNESQLHPTEVTALFVLTEFTGSCPPTVVSELRSLQKTSKLSNILSFKVTGSMLRKVGTCQGISMTNNVTESLKLLLIIVIKANVTFNCIQIVDSSLRDVNRESIRIDWCGSDQFAPYTNVIMPSVFGVISCLGITGNCIVIYTIVRKTKFRCRHTVPDIFIFNLSLVDLLFLLGMPFLIHQLVGNGTWHFGAAMCTIITTLDSHSQITSTYILTVMSFDRYLATVHPLKSTSMRTPSVATLVICLVWLMSFLTVIPVWLYTGLMPLPDGTVGCALLLPNPTTDIYWFTLYQFMVAFAIPLVVICVIYFKILQHMSTRVAPLPQRSLRMRTRKVTRMAVAICSTFFVCWGPYYIFQLVHLSIEKPRLAFFYMYNFAISLGYANSCINPFLYIALSETFKRQFLMTIRPPHQRFRFNNSVAEEPVIKLSSDSTQQMRFTGRLSPNSLPAPDAVQ